MSVIAAESRPHPFAVILLMAGSYVVASFAFTLVLVMGATSASRLHLPVWMLIGSYLVIGFLLNRLVLRRAVYWHPMYSTLRVVTNAKLMTWLLWPLAYPLLVLRLLVNWLL